MLSAKKKKILSDELKNRISKGILEIDLDDNINYLANVHANSYEDYMDNYNYLISLEV